MFESVRLTLRGRNVRLFAGLLLLSALATVPGGCGIGQNAEVTSVEPSHGPPTGGTEVTIIGANLELPVAVTFNDVAATDLELIHSRALTAVTPPGTPGPATISLIFADGSVVTIPSAFTYDEEELSTAELPLTITAVTPDSGPDTGGTELTIQGTNFVPEAVLLIGGQPALELTFLGDSLLTAVTPPGVAGAAEVVLNTGDGRSTDYPPGFTYLPPDSPLLPQPTITAVEPPIGPQVGGTTVTVQGTLFEAGTVVVFGETLASQTSFVSSTILTAVTPAHRPGLTDVSVVLPDARRVTLADAFEFQAPPIPTITAIAPANGPIAGGTSVTIQGSGFSPGTQVFFGSIAAMSISYRSAQTLVVVTPPQAAGLVDVTVELPDGREANAVAAFEYVAPPNPTIASIDPNTGPTAGGTTVTVIGTDFRAGAVVLFGTTAAESVSVLSGTALTAVTPAHAAGLVDVTVTNADGTSITFVDGFEFLLPPALAVYSMEPNHGPPAGGTVVTLLGEGFTAGATVVFGLVASSEVNVLGADVLTAVAPPQAAKTVVPLIVTLPDGQTFTTIDFFTYDSPTLLLYTSLSPVFGPEAGGTEVTIQGTGFEPGMTVTFDGLAAEVTILSDTLLTVLTPAHAAGIVDVVLARADGQTFTAAAAYEYVGPATLTYVSLAPVFGPEAGGTEVTIQGTGFVPGMTVTFDGLATEVAVLSPALLTAITPPHAAGFVDVVLTAPDAQTVTAAGAFEYVGPATLTYVSLAPVFGPEAGGTEVTIQGTGFLPGMTVTFDGLATGVTVLSPALLTAITPPHAAGFVDAVLTTPDAQTVTAAAAFQYVGPIPTISGLTPASGPEAGGTTVLIEGIGFTGMSAASDVQFGGVDADSYTVLSDTQVVAVTPAGTGTVAVVITSPTGQAAALFTYIPPAVPPTPPPTEIASLTPGSGPEAGGTTVLIEGIGFTGMSAASDVQFGGVDADSYTVLSDTQVVAVTPAGTGMVAVVVTSPTGQAAALFTYVPPVTPPALPPTAIASLTPGSGPEAGGTTVLIEGIGFTGMSAASDVQFGGVDADSYTVLSDTQVVAVTPAGTGTVAVVITSPTGQAAALFTYIPPTEPPATAISLLTPASGPEAGGTTVLIEGIGFTGMSAASDVQFGGVDADSYTVLSDTQVVAVTPAGTGTVAVVITSPTGQAAALFTYIPPAVPPTPPPTEIASLTPGSGPEAGGTTVLIEGIGFTGMSAASDVQFGGVDADSYTVLSDTQVVAVTPAGTGTVAVVITSPTGQAAALFTYVPPVTPPALPPTAIASLTPGSGPEAGGTTVLIEGIGFTGMSAASDVQFGGVDADSYTVLSDTQVVAVTPAGTGMVAVVVTSPTGQAAALFTYLPPMTPPPVITSIESLVPASGPLGGGTLVLITGTGLAGTSGVMFGATAGTVVEQVSDSQITVTSPAATTPGPVAVVVTATAGQAAALFTYVPLTIASISPDTGPDTGGTIVTITGTGFTAVTGASGVQFDGTDATDYVVLNDTELQAVAPAHAVGTVPVTITAGAETAEVFYTYRP